MNKYKKLVFNTGIFAIGTFGSKILVLLLNRLYTANLSTDSMGIKGLLITAALFLQPIFTFALQEYLIRFGLDKNYDKREVFNTSAVMTAAGMALMTLVLPFLGYIPALEFIKGYTVLLLIYVVTSSFRMLCQQFIRAIDKVKLFSIDGIFAALTLLVFNIIFISVLHWGVKGFMLATILSDLCSTIFLFTAAKLRDYTGAEFFNKKLAAEMLRFAGPFIPTIVMWTITSLSDRLFINKMHSDYYQLGKSAAGIYECANVIPNLISMVSTIFYQAWSMSAISENSSTDRNRFYGKVYSAYEAMLFIASAALLIIVKPVTSIFMVSDKYSEYATVYRYTPILIAAVVFMSLNQFLGSIYSATKHPKNSFWTALVACGVNLPMNFFLIPLWGIQGAAVATLLSYLICFWARIIDARYYVPFHFDGLKNLANTAILLGMCIMMIFEVKLYIVWMLLLAAVIAALNYKSLLITVNKLLKRS